MKNQVVMKVNTHPFPYLGPAMHAPTKPVVVFDCCCNLIAGMDGEVPPPRSARGSLKEFVKQFKDRHYHVIEMRIVLICSFGIFVKLFFSDVLTQLSEHLLTYSALTFIACEWAGWGEGLTECSTHCYASLMLMQGVWW